MSSPEVTDRLPKSVPKLACLVCRQRKVACNRRRPKCGLCAKNNLDCQYVSRDRRPGLRAGFVSQLEQRLERLEGRVRELEQGAGHAAQTLDSEMHAANPEQNNLTPAVLAAQEDTFQKEPAEVIPEPGPQPGPESEMRLEAMEPPAVFDPLSYTTMCDLCAIWFRDYHPWFPILHQPSLDEALTHPSQLQASEHYLVIQAIVAVTLQHYQGLSVTPEQRRHSSGAIRDAVVIDAIKMTSLQSVQALLILSTLDYGEGRTSQCWNLLGLCKRMTACLGLREVVSNHRDETNSSSAASPRFGPSPKNVIEREEQVRAYWMTEMLDSISTIGAGFNVGIMPPPTKCVLPCSDSIWAFPEHIIDVWSIGAFHYSSAFSLCIILAVSELWTVHSFLQKPYDMKQVDERLEWQSEAQQIDERLTMWREEFVAAVFRLINAEFPQDSRAEMDPNIVLTNCVLNTSVIALFQRRAPCPEGVDQPVEPWPYATNRCVYACENMAAKIRRIDQAELENVNPHLIFSIFVAARFYIVYSKALDADVPRNLHSLAFALHACSERWPVARRYEAVIRTAVAEHRTAVSASALPVQFYDLRYSTLELSDTLQAWADHVRPEPP